MWNYCAQRDEPGNEANSSHLISLHKGHPSTVVWESPHEVAGVEGRQCQLVAVQHEQVPVCH